MTDKSPTLEELEAIVDDSDSSVHELLREEFGRGAEEEESAEDVQEEAPEAAEEDKEGEESEGEEEKDDHLEPPPEWTAEEHELFRKLDPASQKWVLDRVNTAQEVQGKASQASKQYEAIESVLAPHRDRWARDGMSEAVAIKQLVALSDYAASKPTEFIAWFASQRGIDLGQLTGKQPEPDQGLSDAQMKDPAVRALAQRYEVLEKKLSEIQGQTEKITGSLTHKEQEAAAAQERQNREAIQNFMSETDESGKPKRPYFSQVREMMGVLLENGKAAGLEDAYDRACRADPDVWAKIEQAQKARESQETAKQSRGKAAAARIAGSSVSGSPGSRSEPVQTGDLRDDLRALFAEKGMV